MALTPMEALVQLNEQQRQTIVELQAELADLRASAEKMVEESIGDTLDMVRDAMIDLPAQYDLCALAERLPRLGDVLAVIDDAYPTKEA